MYLNAGSGGVGGVGDCTCLPPTLDDLGDTSGPRIDRIPSTRPPWWRRQYRELKKIFFSPPSKCPIDLFGPVANRTILKRLHVASCIPKPSVSLTLDSLIEAETLKSSPDFVRLQKLVALPYRGHKKAAHLCDTAPARLHSARD